MNENSLWAIFWLSCTLTIVGISAGYTYQHVTELQIAANNGLQQQLIGRHIIWVKVKE